MPYEIPQQLKYEEKIIFGLTFKQLVFAVIFIFPALFIFLKTSWNMYVKVTLGALLIGIAFLFMFFDFFNYLKDLISWLKFREAWLMEPKMIQFLGIETIKNSAIYIWKTKKPVQKKKLSKDEKRKLSEKISNLGS